MRIAITMDSACDISQQVKEIYNFKTVPFTVLLGDKIFEDGNINTMEIFDYVDKTGILPKTSAVNENAFINFFTELKKEYDAIIHFDISSSMSAAYQNACNAAKKIKDVYVIDSGSLSTGITLLAIYASELTKKISDPKKIVKLVQERVDKVQASFVIERLDYLYKGGRCSSLAYFGANLLKLRPQIVVSKGAMKSNHKYRGKMPKVVTDYCNDVLSENPDADKEVCFITHSHATDEMVEAARKAVTNAGFKTIYETYAGCTVSSTVARTPWVYYS